jgi:large subunit ribosomal protein L6
MSRVGKRPIKLEQGVKVSFAAPVVEVSGKGGKLSRKLPATISVETKGDQIHIINTSDSASARALHGLSRSLIQNMVIGVAQGYTKQLELQGVGYRAATKGTFLNLSLGFSHPVEFELPAGITATVEANTKITLKGADKDLLGVTAARLRKVRPPEPYKGKGIRFAGEQITLKQGKTAGK